METVKFSYARKGVFRCQPRDIPGLKNASRGAYAGITGLSQLEREAGAAENTEAEIFSQNASRPGSGRKFMQTVDKHVYSELARIAEKKGVTVQGLIRAVIVPEWMTEQRQTPHPTLTHTMMPETLPVKPAGVPSGIAQGSAKSYSISYRR